MLPAPKRRTYARSFRARFSGGPSTGGGGASVPKHAAAQDDDGELPSRARRSSPSQAAAEDGSTDDDAPPSQPGVKRTRSTAGLGAEETASKGSTTLVASSRSRPRRGTSASQQTPAEANAPAPATARASRTLTTRRTSSSTLLPSPVLPPPPPAVPAKRKAAPLNFSLATSATTSAQPPARRSGYGRPGVGGKAKGRAGLEIILPGMPSALAPADEDFEESAVSQSTGNAPQPAASRPTKQVMEADAANGQATATARHPVEKPSPPRPAPPARSPSSVKTRTPLNTSSAALSLLAKSPSGKAFPHSPKRIRLSPPSHLKTQTPPGDILQDADYFSFPSPSRNAAVSVPSSPLTPLSSSVNQSSPLRPLAAPGSPTPQKKSRPTPLGPASPARTPTRSAADLGGLFGAHLARSGASADSSASFSRAEGKKEGGEGAPSSGFGSGGVDEESASLGTLVNLPPRKRKVGALLQRSNTTPSLASTSAAGGRNALTRGGSALFPSPKQPVEPAQPSAAAALWDIPVPSSPSSSSQPSSPSQQQPSPLRPAPPTKRRTYGGSSRSMLVVADPTEEDGEGARGRESYAKMARRWGLDQGGEDGGFVDDTIELATVTSLRARGGNQSFLDDLGYLLDGLRSSELGVRRSSALELLRKMGGQEFRRSLKTYDQVEGLWEILAVARGGKSDMVLDASFLLFLAILAKDPGALDPILAKRGKQCCAFVKEALQAANDGLVQQGLKGKGWKGKGRGRAGGRIMDELRKLYVEAEVGGPSPSMRSAASSVLKHIAVESGSKLDVLALLEAAGLREAVAQSLRNELAELPQVLKEYENGTPMFANDDPPDLQHVQQCLVVLDALLNRSSDAPSSLADLPRLLGSLIAVLRAELRNPTIPCTPLTALLCLLSALRTLYTFVDASPRYAKECLVSPPLLTTLARLIQSSRIALDRPTDRPDEGSKQLPAPSSPLTALDATSRLSSFLATSDVGHAAAEQAQDAPAAQLEVLCLCLGLLSKLVETVEDAKERARETRWSASCSEERSCAVVCRCEDGRSMLLGIVELYEGQRGGSSAEAAYLAGYAVLLLAHLMRGSPENTALIINAVPLPPASEPASPSADERKLVALADELQSFSDVHQRFHDKLSSLANAADEPAACAELDEEGLKEIRSGVGALPSKEAGVGAVREMVGVLKRMAGEAGRVAGNGV